MAAQQHPTYLHFTTNADGFQTLLALPQSDQSQPCSTEALAEQSLLYVDTTAFDLLRLGFTVTVQPRKEKFMVTVQPLDIGCDDGDNKSAGRLCVEAMVPTMKKALNPARWPDKLAAALPQKRATGKKFKPVALLQQVNHRRQIELAPQSKDKDASSILVKLDESTVWLPNATQDPFATVPSTLITHLYDVYVAEAVNGQKPGTLTKQLQQVVPLAIVEESHIARALSAIGSHGPTATAVGSGIQPTMPMAEACRTLLYEQLVQMICNEAGSRFSEDIEHVHQMRVAIRRMRAAAKLFGQASQQKALRPYVKEMRKIGKLLGAVRDRDVAIAKAQQNKAHRTTAKQIDAWQERRAEAHAALVAWLDSADYRQFVIDFYIFCASPRSSKKNANEEAAAPALVEVQPYQARHVVPSLLVERFAAVRAYELIFADYVATPYATLHALRIQCKYLRYALEFTQQLLSPAIEPLIEQIKQFQDLLGDLNDAVVAVQMLEAEQPAQPTKKQSTYLRHQEELIATLRAAVPQAFAEVVGYNSRRALSEAMANL